MSTQRIQSFIVVLLSWWCLGTNLWCIVHCHLHHDQHFGQSQYVCAQPQSPEAPAPSPIDHQTLQHLSQIILVTMTILLVVMMHERHVTRTPRWHSWVGDPPRLPDKLLAP